jgi:Ca2+-binding RTX toxin-like protein
LTFDAGNGIGADATQNFSLGIDAAPVFTSATGAAFTPGTATSFTIQTTGFPTSALSESGALPAGISLVNNEDGTATLAGTAQAGSQGNYSLTLTAVAGGVTATQVFTLTVGAPGATPPQVVLDGTALVGVGTSTADIASISFSGGNVTMKVDTASMTVAVKSITEIDVTLLGGNDFLTIGPGVPAVNAFGGAGSDTIIAANAFDTLGGGAGPDSLVAGSGNNILDGGNGADTLVAGSGNDTLTGDNGIDSLVGGPGYDLLKGGAGNDTLQAGSGYNTLNGNTGNDVLQGYLYINHGSGGHAVLNGGPGNDTIIAGANDTPEAGGGNPLILS